VGNPVDGNISKDVVSKQTAKIREHLLELEDLYYVFRDDVESTLQKIKYRLDKLAQQLGEMNDVD